MSVIHKMSIKEIREWIEKVGFSSEIDEAMEKDERIGVHKLLVQYRRLREKEVNNKNRWDQMTEFERHFWEAGFDEVAGIDEVGRGPLAGPVVAAAVILPSDFYLPGLNDSKKVPEQTRESFYDAIIEHAAAWNIVFVDVDVIDEINIYQATQRAMLQAVNGLSVHPAVCLVDGMEVRSLPFKQQAIIGGDGKSVSIAAASIIAKVTRDRWMKQMAEKYPVYGFERNAGYGTSEHLEAIQKYGPCPLHRRTFGGVKEWFE
jgi:ribonuclease HII